MHEDAWSTEHHNTICVAPTNTPLMAVPNTPEGGMGDIYVLCSVVVCSIRAHICQYASLHLYEMSK